MIFSSWHQVLILLILLLLSAFFSLAETALTKLSRIRLRNMQNDGVKSAKLIQRIVENPNKLISTILIGNNLVNISASTLTASIAMGALGNNSVALGLATGILTFVILVFCEMTPKILAAQNAEKMSTIVARPIRFCLWLFAPFSIALGAVSSLIIKIIGGDADDAPIVTEAELKTMVDVSFEEGVLMDDEQEMINNVFDFGDFTARDVMTPRTDIVAIPFDSTPDEIIEVFKIERFSRLPVYKETTDHIVGILYLKDFAFLECGDSFDVSSYMRKPFFTYETKPTRELFATMRNEFIHMAVVLDEYGGTSGIVTMEDLVEEIVGEISDEYDDYEQDIEAVSQTEFFVLGETRIEDVNDVIGTDIYSEDFDSIGGYVMGQMGRIPEKDDEITLDGFKFIVWEMDKNRIEKLKILKDTEEPAL